MKSKFLKRMLQLMLAGVVLIVISLIMKPDLWRHGTVVFSEEDLRAFLDVGKEAEKREAFVYDPKEHGITKIEVLVSASDVKISETDDNLLSGELYAGKSVRIGHEVVGNTLRIEVASGKKWNLSFFDWGEDRQLNLLVPKELIADVEVRTVSGDVAVVLPQVGKFHVETVSGEIHGRWERAETVHTSTTSGKTNLKVSSGNLDAEMTSVSGEIELEAEIVDRLIAESTSGDIQVHAKEMLTKKEGRVYTVSGDIELRGVSTELGMDLTTLSGTISVWDILGGKNISRSGDGMLHVETASGNITVK